MYEHSENFVVSSSNHIHSIPYRVSGIDLSRENLIYDFIACQMTLEIERTMPGGLGKEAHGGSYGQEHELRKLLDVIPEDSWRDVGLPPYTFKTHRQEMRLRLRGPNEEEMMWHEVSQLSANLLQRENCIRLAHVTLDHPHSTWAL